MSIKILALKYFCDMGKINFLTKTDKKIRLVFKTGMKKLIE